MGGGCVKVCSECHSEVETGWQYCHTCGASSHSPVYRIAADGGSTVPDDLSSFDLPDSAFVSLAAGTLAHAWTSLSRTRSHAR